MNENKNDNDFKLIGYWLRFDKFMFQFLLGSVYLSKSQFIHHCGVRIFFFSEWDLCRWVSAGFWTQPVDIALTRLELFLKIYFLFPNDLTRSRLLPCVSIICFSNRLIQFGDLPYMHILVRLMLAYLPLTGHRLSRTKSVCQVEFSPYLDGRHRLKFIRYVQH